MFVAIAGWFYSILVKDEELTIHLHAQPVSEEFHYFTNRLRRQIAVSYQRVNESNLLPYGKYNIAAHAIIHHALVLVPSF